MGRRGFDSFRLCLGNRSVKAAYPILIFWIAFSSIGRAAETNPPVIGSTPITQAITQATGIFNFLAVDVESRVALLILKAAFLIFMDIIDEISEIRKAVMLEGRECNTVIIPEDRRGEIENFEPDWVTPSFVNPTGKKYVFGCEIIFSWTVDKIKVGYLK